MTNNLKVSDREMAAIRDYRNAVTMSQQLLQTYVNALGDARGLDGKKYVLNFDLGEFTLLPEKDINPNLKLNKPE
jgi:hypothetical protein